MAATLAFFSGHAFGPRSCDSSCTGCSTCATCYSWGPCYWFPDDEVKCRPDPTGANCPLSAGSCSTTPTSTQYNTEHLVLQELQSSTGGTTWFDPSVNHCQLQHVGCSNACLGPVNQLQLTNLPRVLSGTIPNSLTQLTALSVVDMSRNAISGTANLALWLPLTYSNLNNNALSGSLAADPPTDSTMQYLGFRGNKVSGSIPNAFSGLTALEHIVLQVSASAAGDAVSENQCVCSIRT